MAKRLKSAKKVAGIVAKGVFKIWLKGRPFRVREELFRMVLESGSEEEAYEMVEKNKHLWDNN